MTTNPHHPRISDGPEAGSITLLFSPVAVGSFARDGLREGVDRLHVGRYSKTHGRQWSCIEFTEAAGELRQLATRERLWLHCAHAYAYRGIRQTIIRVREGVLDGPRLKGLECAAVHGAVTGQEVRVDITGLGSRKATIVQMTAPDGETHNYGAFTRPLLELTIPKQHLMLALTGYAREKFVHV